MITSVNGVNTATGPWYRLVTIGKKATIINATETETQTSTRHQIKEFATEQEALDRVKELGLELGGNDD